MANLNSRYHYDIHGIVCVSSDIPLSELSFFRGSADGKTDLVVQTGLNRAATSKRLRLNYTELGPIGATFTLEFSNPLRVNVSPFLAKSMHVVYTNIVEPLLRFIFVSKGHVLLHSACLSTPIGGLLLSAPADTGKTTTILKILQSTRCLFLSDDMTVLHPSSEAYCFPKPPTISHHTLKALGYDYRELFRLPFLILRSYIHSRATRRMMHSLGKTWIPILSLNALGQIIVPPPKPPILSLVDPKRLEKKCEVKNLFFLDRGKHLFKEFSLDEALERVEANNDNAFNFPPYSRIVQHFQIDGFNYWELRSMEKDLLRDALRMVNFYYLRVEDYSWHKHIAQSFEAIDYVYSILGEEYVKAII